MIKYVKQSFELFNPRPAGELYSTIEAACRISRRSVGRPEAQESFMRKLIAMGHETVLEHASASALITTDRGIMAELTRHRLASFTVESTRYVGFKSDGDFQLIHPCEDFLSRPAESSSFLSGERAEEFRAVFDKAALMCREVYKELRRVGYAAERARSVLPLSLATRLMITANIREWRTIMRLRTSSAAHPLMRELMLDGLAKLKALYPVLFEDI